MSDKPLIDEIREIIWTPPPLPDIEDYSGTPEADEITRLRAEVAELRKWKTAIIDRLVVQESLLKEHETNPKKAVHDIVSWEVRVALDPLVSSEAEALIDQGRNELRAENEELRDQIMRIRAEDRERIAILTAHRACTSEEHNLEQGRLHGYCVVCGVPWPCEFARMPGEEVKS